MSMWNAANLARACRVCAASLAGFALVILSGSLAEALYGPRTTIGADYQQWSNTTSTNGNDQGTCNNTDVCYVLFYRAPQQKALIVQHVSCIVEVSGDLRFGSLSTRKGETFRHRHTALIPVAKSAGYDLVNSPVLHLIKSGERALVYFLNSTTTDWLPPRCTISGKLLQP